jgi:hypothetical protein
MGYENPQIVARKIAIALKPFALGVYASLFNRPDQLQLTNEQLVCFDVYDVPDRLRLPFIHQLLAFIQRQTLRRYRLRGSVIVLDEGHLLLHDERSARILEHLVRNGRKAGQLMLFTQHTHSDSQRNRSAQLAHKTAGATLVFRINRQDVATLDDLHLSELEKQIVVEQNEGECLLVAPNAHLRLKILIPPAWYPRFTTKPREVLEQQAKAQQVSAAGNEPEVTQQAPLAPAAAMPAPVPPTAPMPAQTLELTNTLVPVVAALAVPQDAPAADPLLGDLSTWSDPAAAGWENILVGSNQVAADWLRLAQQHSQGNAAEGAPVVEAAPQDHASYLRLVWSRYLEAAETDEEGGGDTLADRKIGG